MTLTSENSARQLFSWQNNVRENLENLVGYQNQECETMSANMAMKFGLGSGTLYSGWKNGKNKVGFL